MIAILDYEAGNQTSVRRALDSLGIACEITADPVVINKAHGIIFPGVGAAGQAMQYLQKSGLDALLLSQVEKDKPLLGICLGCQIILSASEENKVDTLGLIIGTCRAFSKDMTDEDGNPAPVVHMGWNRVALKNKEEPLFAGISPEAEFYFVHGYYPVPASEYVLGLTTHGVEFCSFFGREGLWAVQFHPEKSGRAGLTLLKNFAAYCVGKGGEGVK